MKAYLFRDWICPIGMCCGTVCLFYLIVLVFVKYSWMVGFMLLACWLYGIVFVDDIIPFFKRVFAKKD